MRWKVCGCNWGNCSANFRLHSCSHNLRIQSPSAPGPDYNCASQPTSFELAGELSYWPAPQVFFASKPDTVRSTVRQYFGLGQFFGIARKLTFWPVFASTLRD
jgi:hypothetical protein